MLSWSFLKSPACLINQLLIGTNFKGRSKILWIISVYSVLWHAWSARIEGSESTIAGLWDLICLHTSSWCSLTIYEECLCIREQSNKNLFHFISKKDNSLSQKGIKQDQLTAWLHCFRSTLQDIFVSSSSWV